MSEESNYPWCVVFVNTTNADRYGEIFEIGAIGCDGVEFHSQCKPESKMSIHTHFEAKELEEGKLDTKGFKEFLARYDVVATWNAWFLAPKLKDMLPTSAMKKSAGAKTNDIMFSCALSQLEWPNSCRKLSCLSGVSAKDNRSTLDRCRTLLKLLKRDKLYELVNTADTNYYLVSPTLIPPKDRWQLKELGFHWHYTKPIKYCTADEISKGFPFPFVSKVVPRKNLFVATKD